MSRGISRRGFVAGALSAGAAVGAGAVAGCSPEPQVPQPTERFIDFEGAHQPGITALPIPEQGLVASFNVHARNRAELASTLRELTDEIRGLMAGKPPETRDPAYPPVDSGILGEKPPADNLSIVVGVGASLFDDRFGLADRKPRELITMPFLANDRLDPKLSHGDISVIFEAGHNDTMQFALRQLMRRTRSDLVLRWMIDGYARGIGAGAVSEAATPRNLLGFKDGTSNLDVSDDALLDRHVWVGPDDDEPDWTVGGTYQAVRIIRNFVEFWDRTQLVEQEALIGRAKVSGAPLGMAGEFDEPDFAADPDGQRIKLNAHIRLANPRTPESEQNRILRRGFNYSRGFDGAGRLDQGLAFISYQRSLQKGFLAVQARLKGEPLEEYIMPVGGGFFFVLPGVMGHDRFLGDELVD
ncbi:Dyp-type peroxidase [Mycolicibacterium diernhoferi]|uniref:Peroxidase n=1 Tax=Mycolicibacterium diernhoferi TaxID=1801 RepID=A0A1Q4H6K1_9MYCO|nr:Dyp-type peroxidase [Mycolicibacterium diernhoferi]OJZ63095.1 peroxidase [Mycolicibacterium diernhoferi]OPE46707.1 peroxidase [Mycolicibacterium diernhoferi]PEG53227.1 deferrochelatase/peroxidase EfeB [Mycolicibacterium diernhoferi]QYL21865.1 Dyp-type peroxidase [Mycolicibacterium diernhoferi]